MNVNYIKSILYIDVSKEIAKLDIESFVTVRLSCWLYCMCLLAHAFLASVSLSLSFCSLPVHLFQ